MTRLENLTLGKRDVSPISQELAESDRSDRKTSPAPRERKGGSVENYRGWVITWDYGYFTATGPNYDASWEGEEDGWVSNGQRVQARTLEGVQAEVDAWFEENEPTSCAEVRTEGWRTDTPNFMDRPIYQFVLLEGYQEHSGRRWRRLWAGTATIDRMGRFGYRASDIDRIQRDGDMIVVERVKGWLPAVWPRWDLFASVDERPEGQDPEGLEAKPASAIGAAETPKTSPIESEIERLGGGA